MLNWCSYCQRFIGETPPYDDFGLSHGACTECQIKAASLTEADYAHAQALGRIQKRLRDAGRRGDLHPVEDIIDQAAKENIAGVDVLIGLVAPLLYQIGEEWKRHAISVADEHRFTAFCEKVYELVAARKAPANAEPAGRAGGTTLLMNAPGNKHTLGVRILSLWLANKGQLTQVVAMPRTPQELQLLIDTARPTRILVSISLAEQSESIVTLTAQIAALPETIRPPVLVGGYCVKAGLVSAIPGANLVTDLTTI